MSSSPRVKRTPRSKRKARRTVVRTSTSSPAGSSTTSWGGGWGNLQQIGQTLGDSLSKGLSSLATAADEDDSKTPEPAVAVQKRSSGGPNVWRERYNELMIRMQEMEKSAVGKYESVELELEMCREELGKYRGQHELKAVLSQLDSWNHTLTGISMRVAETDAKLAKVSSTAICGLRLRGAESLVMDMEMDTKCEIAPVSQISVVDSTTQKSKSSAQQRSTESGDTEDCSVELAAKNDLSKKSVSDKSEEIQSEETGTGIVEGSEESARVSQFMDDASIVGDTQQSEESAPKKENAITTTTVEFKSSTMETLKEEIDYLRTRQSAVQQFETLLSATRDENIKALRKELRETTAKMLDLSDENTLLRKQTSASRDRSDTHLAGGRLEVADIGTGDINSEALKALTEQMTADKSEMGSLQATVRELETVVSSLRGQIAQVTETDRRHAKAAKHAKKMRRKKEDELKSIAAEMCVLRARNDVLENEVVSLRSDHASARRALVGELALKQRFEAAMAECSEHRVRIEALQHEVESLKRKDEEMRVNAQRDHRSIRRLHAFHSAMTAHMEHVCAALVTAQPHLHVHVVDLFADDSDDDDFDDEVLPALVSGMSLEENGGDFDTSKSRIDSDNDGADTGKCRKTGDLKEETGGSEEKESEADFAAMEAAKRVEFQVSTLCEEFVNCKREVQSLKCKNHELQERYLRLRKQLRKIAGQRQVSADIRSRLRGRETRAPFITVPTTRGMSTTSGRLHNATKTDDTVSGVITHLDSPRASASPRPSAAATVKSFAGRLMSFR